MSRHPEVQQRAVEEVDVVTRRKRRGPMVIRRRDAEAGADADAETQITD